LNKKIIKMKNLINNNVNKTKKIVNQCIHF